ncbi:probable BRI1 kinase inhibitor 1 [Lolium perenne]|uniref:probable BRI1 kinase inhibitor 1 n=1 Tax=Lolium perenne TaxID=4522 RepID=UPI0021EA22E3|nr:probable BRI1 kinase inhibitor 1 [Lolium perenne]
MDAPRPRSPPPLFMPTTPPPPPPSPPPFFPSPSHDFSFSFPPLPSSPPPFHARLRALPLPAVAADMSRTPIGRVGSDISHNNYAKANRRHQTTSHTSSSEDFKDRDRAKNRASPFFSGFGGAWRSGEGRDDAAEDRRKVKGKRGPLEVGQRVRKYMASLVEQLLASFSRLGERERREQRRRPHSFSGSGPGAAAAAARERERWRQRRGQLSSAPASLRASPVNSGHLSVGGSVKVSTSSEESTMEELQSAIQAAIAHCKNSIAVAKE